MKKISTVHIYQLDENETRDIRKLRVYLERYDFGLIRLGTRFDHIDYKILDKPSGAEDGEINGRSLLIRAGTRLAFVMNNFK